MLNDNNSLIIWAEGEGFSLRPLERELLANVMQGKAVCGTKGSFNKKHHVSNSAWRSDDNTVRATLLSRLILDEKAKRAIHRYGIRIYEVYIEGDLNLDTATIPFPLVLQDCYIPKPIDLRDANTRLISFKGSHTGPIEASRVFVDSSLALNEGFWAKGEVRLHGAHIKGQFDCRQGRFCNRNKENAEEKSTIPKQNKYALMAKGIKVDCNAYMTGVSLFGAVIFSGASICDNFECDGGHFFNPKGIALEADRIRIGGHIYFTVCEGDIKHEDPHYFRSKILHKKKSFKAFGQLSLIQAHINGSLYCRSAALCDKGQIALDLREANIAGSAWFSAIETNGLIRLTGSVIKGCLYCVDAKFIGERRAGLIGKALKVGGTFVWTSIDKSPTTQLDLRYATVGQLEDDVESWPDEGNLILDGLVYNSIVTRITKEIKASQKISHMGRLKLWFFNYVKLWISQKTGENKKEQQLVDKTRIDWLERQLTERFTGADIGDFPGLAHQIIHSKDSVSKRLKSRLLKEDLHKIEENQQKDKHLSKIDEKVLLLGLNDLLQDTHLLDEYCKEQQCNLEGRKDIQELIEQRQTRDSLDRKGLAQLNCWILKKVYKQINEDAKPLRRYFREQPYEQLASFLRGLGMDAEVNEILIAKNEAKRKYGNLPWLAKFWMGRYQCTTDYGYRPFKAALKGMLFIVIGWMFFMAGYRGGFMVPSKEYAYLHPQYLNGRDNREINSVGEPNVTDIKDRLPKEYPEFYSFIYSVEVFVPFLDLHQKAYWLPGHQTPIDQRVSQQKRKWYDYDILVPFFLHVWLWFEICVGWILSTFFVGGVLRLMHELHLHKKE